MACPLGLLDRSLGVQRLLVASAFEGLVPETADIRQSRRVTLTSLLQSSERLGAARTARTSGKTKKKSAHLERSFLYSKKSNPDLGDIRMYWSSSPVEFEFTTLQLQMTAPQTRMNARGLFTTLFSSLRL